HFPDRRLEEVGALAEHLGVAEPVQQLEFHRTRVQQRVEETVSRRVESIGAHVAGTDKRLQSIASGKGLVARRILAIREGSHDGSPGHEGHHRAADVGRRRRPAHARARHAAARPPRPVPAARRVQVRSAGRLPRRLSGSPAPRVRDRHLHARRRHASPRSCGKRGRARPGSVQWMTAGRGIVHSEMPLQKDGLMWGLQLWVNLPARSKMTAPRYQDIPPEKIPEVELAPGVRARVIAGEAAGVHGPVEGIVTQPLYLDVRMESRSCATLVLTPGHAACAYVYEGQVALGADAKAQEIAAGRLAVLGDGDRLTAVTGGAPARFLLLAARPLREPIARYGPFVMNTREEIVQAVEDYRSGALASGV